MVELAGGKDNYYKTLKDLGVENYNNLPEEVKNRIDRQLESNIKQFVDDTAKKALNGKTLDELKQARNETSEKAFGEKGVSGPVVAYFEESYGSKQKQWSCIYHGLLPTMPQTCIGLSFLSSRCSLYLAIFLANCLESKSFLTYFNVHSGNVLNLSKPPVSFPVK